MVAGALLEHNLSVGADARADRSCAGAASSPSGPTTSTGSPATCDGSVSVHAYSPPLWRMGQYAVSDAGVLRRESVSYADELRPLEDASAD